MTSLFYCNKELIAINSINFIILKVLDGIK